MADPILLNLDTQHYYYGTTPKQAVAEQNQTYFAYFDTLADTSPILQDHTAYYVKYLIDTEGNPVNPEPESNPNRPQAIGLYNLLNDFEVSKSAVVKTITNDPLYDIPPDSYMLNGSFPIKHVGRLALIATTTTGSGFNDYSDIMVFSDQFGNALTAFVPDLYFNQTYGGGLINMDATSGQANPNYNLTNYFNSYWSKPAGNQWRFEYPSSPNTRIRFRINLLCRKEDPGEGGNEAGYITGVLTKNGNTIYTPSFSALNNWTDGGAFSPYVDVAFGDTFRVYFVYGGSHESYIGGVSNPEGYGTYVEIEQQTPTGEIFINGVTGTTASYWTVDTSNYEPLPGLSILTASQYLTQLYNAQNLIQNTPTASREIGFPNINTFFNPILPGDKIKFTLNETDVHTIMNVNVDVIGLPLLYLTITPPVDSVTVLDNFTIYRIVNDGASVILDVKKDISGSAYAGIVQPQFISNELVNNYDKIIINLTEREIIN
jgi:hypothetical protein